MGSGGGGEIQVGKGLFLGEMHTVARRGDPSGRLHHLGQADEQD